MRCSSDGRAFFWQTLYPWFEFCSHASFFYFLDYPSVKTSPTDKAIKSTTEQPLKVTNFIQPRGNESAKIWKSKACLKIHVESILEGDNHAINVIIEQNQKTGSR